MGSEKNLAEVLERTTPSLAYEKPAVITLGTVEKLTQGGKGSVSDGVGTKLMKHK